MEAKNGIGIMIGVFVIALVGLIVFQASAQQVGDVTNQIANPANFSLATTTNTSTQYITTWSALGTPLFYNETNGTVGVSGALIAAGNYTVANNVLNPTTNALSVSVNTTFDNAAWASAWIVDAGTANPLTYDNSSGGRALAGIIVIFFALAIAVVVLSPVLKNKFF